MAIEQVNRANKNINQGWGIYNALVTALLAQHDSTGAHKAAADVILKALFDANTILAANSDNAPAALTIAEQRLIGRITGGNIAALTATQIRALLNVENGAAADQNASEVSIADAGGIITATQVEAALQEIQTDLNAAEAEIVSARGSKSSVDARLDISLNDDGTLKGRYVEFNFPAGCWNYPTSNPAPLDRDVGTNGGMFRHLFDDTTEEFILLEPVFEIPDNLDTAGTVYFSLTGYAKVADGNEVQFRASLSARAKGESWDNAYTTKDSGDYVTDAQQDELDQIEWSETVASLGLAAKDLLRLMVSRIAIADGTPVSGDYCFLNLKIRIPVT